MGIYQVAKAIITIDAIVQDIEPRYLLSIKRDPGSNSEGKLEFLGGRLDGNEAPKEALLRELSEEEATGGLARLARDRVNLCFSITTAGAQHFLFPLHLYPDEYHSLQHHPDESFGFELLPRHQLRIDTDKLTFKTNKILEALA